MQADRPSKRNQRALQRGCGHDNDDVTEGDVADSLYIIHSGELRAVVAGDSGRMVELNTQDAGEVFGELMLGGERRAAAFEVTVRAQLTRVTRPEVERALASRPDLAFHRIKRLVQRVRTPAC